MWLFGGSGDEGMDVFIGGLPGKTSTYDIEELLEGFADEASFKFSNKSFSDGSSVNFCVASFKSTRRAMKAVTMIRHKRLGGGYLQLHKFKYRSYHNDRRHTPYSPIHDASSHNSDKRGGERRRNELSVEPFASTAAEVEGANPEQVSVTGYADLARKG